MIPIKQEPIDPSTPTVVACLLSAAYLVAGLMGVVDTVELFVVAALLFSGMVLEALLVITNERAGDE